MIMKQVDSSYIKEVGFESGNLHSGGKIKIVFHSGHEEIREGDKNTFDSLTGSKSTGKHYNEHIKKLPLWKQR